MTTPVEIIDVCNCSKLFGACLDIATPVNSKLSAYYKRSFGHHTIKNRFPVILTKLIDVLVRNKHNVLDVYGADSLDELKSAIGEISKLKHDIQTNKPIPYLESRYPDIKEYNRYIKKVIDQHLTCSWFSEEFLFVECYMYRYIAQVFLNTQNLQELDYFASQKAEAFDAALPLIIALGHNITKLTEHSSNNSDSVISNEPKESKDKEHLKENFLLLLKLNLWGNKCDLSLSGGIVAATSNTLIENITELDDNILCNDSDSIFTALCRQTIFEIIDFVCDNAGYEIFTDFCLADFFVTHQFSKQVRFFVKTFPWYISDVTKRDVRWMLEKLCSSEEPVLKQLGQRWSKYFTDKVWTVEESFFWTTHMQFSEMYAKDDTLFRKLARSKCTFYKGDLNYRKLLGDRNWDPCTPFEDALEGYHPSRLCVLRTLKCDLICGLREGVVGEIEGKDADWLISGNYGVIQYSGKVQKLF